MTAEAAAYQLSHEHEANRQAGAEVPDGIIYQGLGGRNPALAAAYDEALSRTPRQLTQAEISSDIKQANINTVAGALLLACDLIDDLQAGKQLSAAELEFVGHCRDLAAGVSQ